MAIIEARALTKRYKDVVAVDQATFDVEQGQVFGFLGPNGSGKTTTLGMLLGIVRPTGGSFRLFGASTPKSLVAARARIGATLETPNFYPYLSGRDNLRVSANLKGVGSKRIEECLRLVGLTARAKHRFKTYSLGMKQRLALASAMLNDPDLIMLDEPGNGLDPQGMTAIRELILHLAEHGKTIFLSSHLLWEVERTCSHVAIIRNGQIIETGAVKDIVAGTTSVVVKSDDLEQLRRALESYVDVSDVRIKGDAVVATLAAGDLGSLSGHLARLGIHPSHLAAEHRSLEEVFMQMTGGATMENIS